MNETHPAAGRRHLLWRLALAPILVGVMVGVMLLDYHRREVLGLRVVVALACGVALHELYAMCRLRGMAPAAVAGILAVTLPVLPWNLAGIHAPMWIGGALLPLYVLFKLVARAGAFPPESAAATVFGAVYIGLLGTAFHLPAGIEPTDGAFVPTFYYLFIFSCGKGSDMAAFVFGKAFGKHKMAPVISPSKTWEGAIAGGVAGTALGAAFLLLSPLREAYAAVPAAGLILLALLVTIASQVGDLVKSVFKRWAGVKDSGRLLPGFGGMLDMADSFFVSVPVAGLLTELLFRIFR